MLSKARNPLRLPGALAAIALVALAVGCGGGSSSSSSGTEGSTTTATAQEAPSAGRPSAGSAKPKPAKPKPGSEANGSGSAKPQPSIAAEEAAPGGDHSIQEYGSEAQGSEKEAAVAAMRSFIAALAASDYAKVCAGLLASNRKDLAQFSPSKSGAARSCPALLAKLLSPAAAAEAKKAAAGRLGKVRIGEGTAFVLFRPAGGRLSYFVMKEEGGEWKSTSLAAGSPLVP